jgi:hypothetical protein
MFIVALLWNIYFLSAQTYSATLSIDTIKISALNPGDEIRVPIRFNEKSGGLIIGFQFFIEFDHSILKWNGTMEKPQNGLIGFNEKMAYNPTDWSFNDNGIQMVALWNDPKFVGVELEKEEVLFQYIFTYLGGLKHGQKSKLTWGETFEQDKGRIIRGPTEMYSDKMDLFDLKKTDGLIISE